MMTSPAIGFDRPSHSGAGEMRALIRVYDWSRTSLGPAEAWPQSLRTTLNIVLHCKQPMFLAWGPDLIFFYNDAYRALLGGRHPACLGTPLDQALAGIWPAIRPSVGQALSGEGAWSQGLPLVAFRNGDQEIASFTASFTPVEDESGAVAGILCACIETSGKVQSGTAPRRGDQPVRADRADEERLRSLFEQAPGFMARVSGPDHVFEFANRAYMALVEGRDILGKPVREALPEVVEQGLTDLLDQVYATGQPFVAHGRPILLHSTTNEAPSLHYLDFVYQPIVAEDGSVTGIFAQGHDVTERKRAEEALRESDARFRTFAEIGSDWFWETDANHRYVEVLGLPTVVPVTGKTRMELAGGAVASPEWQEHIACLETRQPFRNFEYKAVLNGQTFYLSASARPMFDQGGAFKGYRGVTANITARKEAELLASQKAALLATTLEGMDQGLMVIDGDGHVLLFNRRALDLLDLPEELLASRPHIQDVKDYKARTGAFTASEDTALQLTASEDILSEPSTHVRTRPNGAVLEIRTVPLPDGGAVRTYTDITARRRAEHALIASEARYRALVEASAAIVWRAAPDGSAADSSGWEAFCGQGPEAYKGGGWLQAVHPDDRERAITNWREIVASGQAGRQEYRVRHVDGEYRWVQAIGVPLRDAEGTIQEWVGTATDIHSQRIASEHLRESEERYRALVTATSSILWRAAPDGSIFHIVGFDAYPGPQEDLLGFGWLDLVHPDDRDNLVQEWQAIVASGGPGESVYRIKLADNEYRWVSCRAAPLKGPEGTVREWVGNLIDVHEKKQAEDALRQSREDLRAALEANRNILEHSLDVICAVDENGTFTQVSPRALDVWGYTPEELVGRRYIDLVHPDDVEKTNAIAEQIVSGTPTSGFENRFIRKDGAAVSLLWSSVWSEEHKLMFAVARDLTERLKTEEMLRQAQKMEALGQLTGGVAHDFNNLLMIILGNAEILAEDADDPSVTRQLSRVIMETAERGAELTQHLLTFGRRHPLKPVRLRLDDVAHGIMPLLQRTLGEHIELRTEFARSHLSALTDRGLLENAILNLVVNARDAMPAGGFLTIATGQRKAQAGEGQLPIEQDVVFVTVSDSGIGMSPEVLARVFEPFFTTKPVGKGSGLGLSVVYGFAQQTGGHVSIRSTPGQGTSVTIVLPAVVSQRDAEVSSAAAPVPLLKGKERVLLVEDQPDVLRYVSAQLLSLGYDMTAASDGPEALAALKKDKGFDLLLTDLVLPNGMSGVDLARIARAITPDLKVIFTSGYSEEMFQQHGLARDDIPLLRKPYKRKVLAEMLRSVLESPPIHHRLA